MRRAYVLVLGDEPGTSRAYRAAQSEVEEVELTQAAEACVAWHLGDEGPHRDVWEGATLVDVRRAADVETATGLSALVPWLQERAEEGGL